MTRHEIRAYLNGYSSAKINMLYLLETTHISKGGYNTHYTHKIYLFKSKSPVGLPDEIIDITEEVYDELAYLVGLTGTNLWISKVDFMRATVTREEKIDKLLSE